MTRKADRKALAEYSPVQALESVEEAQFLLSGKKSPRSIINRAYYAMFYAILALLIYEPFSSSKHSGVLGYFNRRFIKEGVFDRKTGRWVNKAFELRQRGDYREYFDVARDQAADLVVKARQFISIVRSHLDEKYG